jgi:hypothetical protein
MRDSWKVTTLDAAAAINPREAALHETAPFVPMDAVHVGKRHVQYFEPRGVRSGARAASGDILFARITPCLENGKVAQVPSEMPQCGGSTEFIVIRGSAIALSDFLYFWATWDETRVKAARLMTGTTGRQRLSAGDLGGLELRLPPILTQRRIVDVLASVDAYIAALQQQADEARTARNAVLHELLTAGGDDWTETTIGATSHFVSARLSPADLDPDMPYIGLEHLDPFSAVITRSGFATNVVASVTPFEGGDVLFGRLRPYLHKVAFATFSGVCSPEVLVLRALPNCEPKFLHALCSADATVKACVEMSAGTRMPRTNASDLASIKVALPPLSEQKRIVEVVAAMEAIISTTEQTVRDAQNLRSGLLSDLISGGHEIPATYDRLLGAA